MKKLLRSEDQLPMQINRKYIKEKKRKMKKYQAAFSRKIN